MLFLILLFLFTCFQVSFAQPVFEKSVDFGHKHALFTLDANEEAIDSIHSFCSTNLDKNDGKYMNCRSQLLETVCSRNQTTIKCNRDIPLLYSRKLQTPEGKQLGNLLIFENDEPIDVVYNFLLNGDSLQYLLQVLHPICQTLICTRDKPVIFKERIILPENRDLGFLNILQGEEPADAVYSFIKKYAIPEFYLPILQKICDKVKCSRSDAIIFSTQVTIPNPEGDEGEIPIGSITILQNEEPCDVVYAFAKSNKLDSVFQENLLNVICKRIQCNRKKAMIYKKRFSSPEGKQLGSLEIFEDEEPADAIYNYLKPSGSLDLLDNLLVMICNEIICTRADPVIYKIPVTLPVVGNVGTLSILRSEEPADAVFNFCKKADIELYYYDVLQHVCSNLACSRTEPAIFSSVISDEHGQDKGLLRILRNEEPVDAIYFFAKEHDIEKGFRINLIDHVCNKLKCNRYIAKLFSQNIVVNDEQGLPKTVGLLEVMENEEAIDVVYDFVTEHNLDEGYTHNMMLNICNNGKVVCTRLKRSLYQKSITMEGRGIVGMLRVLEGEEPADAVFEFIVSHGLPFHAMDTLLDGACEHLNCLRRKAIIYQNSFTLPNNTVAAFEIYGGEEPADAVYEFGKVNNLTYSERYQILVHACKQVQCSRDKASLFTWPVWVDEKQYAGVLEILEGEEPIDKVHTFMVKSTMWKAGYTNHNLLMKRVCASPKIKCNRFRPIVANVSIPNEDDYSEVVAVETLYGGQEPADFLYEMGLKYQLSEKTRRLMLSTLCVKDGIYCSRPHALIYSLDALNVTKSNDCQIVYAGWRWIAPRTLIPLEAFSSWYEDKVKLLVNVTETRLNITEKQLKSFFNTTLPLHYAFQIPVDSFFSWYGLNVSVPLQENPMVDYILYDIPFPSHLIFSFLLAFVFLFGTFVNCFTSLFVLNSIKNYCSRRNKKSIKFDSNNSNPQGNVEAEVPLVVEAKEDISSVPNTEVVELKSKEAVDQKMERELIKKEEIILASPENRVERSSNDNNNNSSNSKVKGKGNKKKATKEGKGKDENNKESLPKKQINFDSLNNEEKNNFKSDDKMEEIKTRTEEVLIADQLVGIVKNQVIESASSKTVEVASELNVETAKKSKRVYISWLSLFIACFIVCFPLGLFFYAAAFEHDDNVDLAMYSSFASIGTVNIYEHDEPADAVYDFCVQEKQARLKTVRYYSPIQDDLLDYICNPDNSNLKCKTKESSAILGTIKLTMHNIPYEFKYRRPSNSSGECVPRHEMGEFIDECVIRSVSKWCKILVPTPQDCLSMLIKPINDELKAFERKRWKKSPPDWYHVLGLTRDVSLREIDITFRKLQSEYFGNVVPYAPVNGNMSAPDHYWDEIPMRRNLLEQGWKELMDPEAKEFFDQPCEWLFNGAMCGRRTKDGGLSILVGNNE